MLERPELSYGFQEQVLKTGWGRGLSGAWSAHGYLLIGVVLTKKTLTTWELWVKFYLEQNEDCSPGGSISDNCEFSSVQFSRSVVSDSLRPHESQHTRPPCPSPTPRVHPNSCPSSRWCHPAISSSVVPFSSCPQSLPASESFPMSQLFTWGGQRIGVSALASVLPKNTQD